MADYVPQYQCTICEGIFGNPEEFVEQKADIYLHERTDEKIEGWESRVASCSGCREKLGKLLSVYHRPYQTDFAKFEKESGLVQLKGSGPKDD